MRFIIFLFTLHLTASAIPGGVRKDINRRQQRDMEDIVESYADTNKLSDRSQSTFVHFDQINKAQGMAVFRVALKEGIVFKNEVIKYYFAALESTLNPHGKFIRMNVAPNGLGQLRDKIEEAEGDFQNFRGSWEKSDYAFTQEQVAQINAPACTDSAGSSTGGGCTCGAEEVECAFKVIFCCIYIPIKLCS